MAGVNFQREIIFGTVKFEHPDDNLSIDRLEHAPQGRRTVDRLTLGIGLSLFLPELRFWKGLFQMATSKLSLPLQQPGTVGIRLRVMGAVHELMLGRILDCSRNPCTLPVANCVGEPLSIGLPTGLSLLKSPHRISLAFRLVRDQHAVGSVWLQIQLDKLPARELLEPQ